MPHNEERRPTGGQPAGGRGQGETQQAYHNRNIMSSLAARLATMSKEARRDHDH
jgi:hypothetical protein